MNIYFVRHGKDEEGYRGGWSQRSLIHEGKEQSKRLANYLHKNKAEYSFNKIISSDLNRAIETATYIGDKFDLKVELNQEWRETNNGVIAGLPNDRVAKEYPGLYFKALRIDERYPGGESPSEFYNRIKISFLKLIDEVLKRNEEVLIVTHSGVINIIYHIINEIEWTNKSKPFKCSHTSLHIFQVDSHNVSVTLSNCIEHLS